MSEPTLRHRAEDWAFRGLLALARVVPRRVMLAAGATVGSLASRLISRRTRQGLENLRLAYGDTMSPREAETLIRNCWRHFGRITVDTLYFDRFDRAAVDRLIEYEGLEHIEEAYRRGKGVLLFSGHYGHWELIAMAQGLLGMPLALVTRPLDNPLLERRLARLRAHSGNLVIHKRRAVREMLKVLGDGGGVAIVLDQDARHEGIFVPFFGRPASTTPTLALLALRTDAAIVPTFSVPKADGTYRVVYEPALTPQQTGDRTADVARLTADCTAVIERWVRHHPELWLWMHRRWKTEDPTTDPNRVP